MLATEYKGSYSCVLKKQIKEQPSVMRKIARPAKRSEIKKQIKEEQMKKKKKHLRSKLQKKNEKFLQPLHNLMNKNGFFGTIQSKRAQAFMHTPP